MCANREYVEMPVVGQMPTRRKTWIQDRAPTSKGKEQHQVHKWGHQPTFLDGLESGYT